ncbi:hypothetical protein JGH11_19555 [Dysgonomonas sp. Marseille-P4677]|uniref:hypothetical protein n=1 Tax=Dysgonomonas sp. Marseille-P4677 TaxID=2364790 RepID=UPI001912586F|nr:hypothetical protein [Dysgonomonas sp. Marseille-P4677]MBK5723068.1 hypothetical protein [Dysgonomonas sp. Marseille-P4677]
MARSKPKPESEKLQDVVNTIEHFESVSKAAKLLEEYKSKLGKQKAIRITDTLQIEVSARLTKAEIIERVKRFIYRHQIDERRLHPIAKNLLYGKNNKSLTSQMGLAV